MSKEERRLLFEKKVKEEEEAAQAARAAAEAAEREAKQKQEQLQNQYLQHLHHPTTAVAAPSIGGVVETSLQPMYENWMFDHEKNQWIRCASVVPPSTAQYYIMQQAATMPPSQQQQQHPTPVYQFIPQLAPVVLNAEYVKSLNISDTHLNGLKSAVGHLMPPQAPNATTLNGSATAIGPLPPDWRCKLDDNDQIYYYNTVTKKTQWRIPTAEATTNGTAASPTDDRETTKRPPLLTTPTTTSISTSTGTSTTATSSSSSSSTCSVRKELKERFRQMLSTLVIKILQAFMRDECKVGRITNIDDFKHLARKFTHVIMEKELSRLASSSDMELLSRKVRPKTEEYIKKYMHRFGAAGFSRRLDDQQQQQQQHQHKHQSNAAQSTQN